MICITILAHFPLFAAVSYCICLFLQIAWDRQCYLYMVWCRRKKILMLNPCRQPPPQIMLLSILSLSVFSRPHFFECSFNLLKY
jgi:hypothetical protein